MRDLQVEYLEILDSQQFDESRLNYSILERRIEEMTYLSALSNSMITLFDHFHRTQVFASANHREVFGFASGETAANFDVRIHPDDFEAVLRNGVSCMRYFFIGNKNALHYKLIREYRILVKEAYKRVTEQIQVLETDPLGNIWLAFCLMDISPDQPPPFAVNSKLIDCMTGDVFTPVDTVCNGKPLLSEREVEILKSLMRVN